MISAAAATGRLVQRLLARAARIVAVRAASHRRSRSEGDDWHSATALWPEFTADIGSTNRAGN